MLIIHKDNFTLFTKRKIRRKLPHIKIYPLSKINTKWVLDCGPSGSVQVRIHMKCILRWTRNCCACAMVTNVYSTSLNRLLGLWFPNWREQHLLGLATRPTRFWGPSSLLSHWYRGSVSPKVNRQGIVHSPPSSVKIKNGGAIPPFPYMSSRHNA
jgi:hypothetical protein